MAMEVDIAIVGGGLGGLALALGLQERGLRGHVFEKAPKARKHHGTTISLAPNGLRALDGIKPGLSSRMMTNGTEISKIEQQIREDGQPEKDGTSLPPLGVFCTIPWRSAQQTLADEIGDPSLIHWRHAFLDYTIVEVWRHALKCLQRRDAAAHRLFIQKWCERRWLWVWTVCNLKCGRSWLVMSLEISFTSLGTL